MSVNVSVLMSTYYGEDPSEVDDCLASTYNQTVTPDEVVIVKDGPLPSALDEVINRWERKYPDQTNIIALEENRGIGAALSIGLEECTHDLIARVDSDDISVEDRFEKQHDFLTDNPEIAVVGGYMKEVFSDGSFIREVPTSPDMVQEYAKKRTPINHPTSMYRKGAVMDVGGYPDLRSMQDYVLWVRLLMAGYQLANLPEVLVVSETGPDLHERRGGLEYARIDYRIQREFISQGFITPTQFVRNLAVRLPVRMMPNAVRSLLYKHVLRS